MNHGVNSCHINNTSSRCLVVYEFYPRNKLISARDEHARDPAKGAAAKASNAMMSPSISKIPLEEYTSINCQNKTVRGKCLTLPTPFYCKRNDPASRTVFR